MAARRQGQGLNRVIAILRSIANDAKSGGRVRLDAADRLLVIDRVFSLREVAALKSQEPVVFGPEANFSPNPVPRVDVEAVLGKLQTEQGSH